MNELWLFAFIAIGSFIIIELFFFIKLFAWVKTSHKERAKAFERIDLERNEISKKQKELESLIQQNLHTAQEQFNKLQNLGINIHAESAEIQQKIISGIKNLEAVREQTFTVQQELFAKQRLSSEKLIKDASHTEQRLLELLRDLDKVLKFLNKRVSSDEVFHEIEQERYQEAQQFLAQGVEPEVIARRLGLSLSELNLLARF